jgi:hypothetical protein
MTYFLTQDKLYLYVPFSQKEEAKELGAKYDPDLKLWYLPPVKDPLDVLQFWSFLENTLLELINTNNTNKAKWLCNEAVRLGSTDDASAMVLKYV